MQLKPLLKSGLCIAGFASLAFGIAAGLNPRPEIVTALHYASGAGMAVSALMAGNYIFTETDPYTAGLKGVLMMVPLGFFYTGLAL